MQVRRVLAPLAGLVCAALFAAQAWVPASFTAAALWGASVSGLASGAILAVAASGLVVTYVTSGVFNFAQGAIGMFLAFVYWQLRVDWGWPTWLSLVSVLGVAAPVFGAGCEMLVMRRIQQAPVVHQIMVTVGLMLALMGIAGLMWPSASVSRTLPPFFGTEGFVFGGITVTWHQTIAVGMAVATAAGLRLLLFRTRFGVSMRACVDDRDLAALNGVRPARVSMAAWALGSTTAALAGILLAPEIPFSVEPLTLLIIDAFAAAILGRLRSLPLTFLGGLLLGLMNAYAITFLNLTGRWSGARAAIPTVFLFFVLLALPQRRIAPGRRPSLEAEPAVPGLRRGAVGMAVLMVLTVVGAAILPPDQVNRVTLALATALIMLSLVPLTGWAGEVSLAPMTFAGVGAFAMAKTAGHAGAVVGLAAAAALAVPAGLAMAAPAVRLRGLYTALASLAFARMMELLVFPQPEIFGISSSGTISVPPLSFGPWQLTSARGLLVVTATVFALVGLGLQALRARPYGRRLIALRDSPAACTTLGIDINRTKLSVYALSAAIAGFGGAMLGTYRQQVGTDDFTMLASLPVVLLLVIGGITTISGALFGGLASVALLTVQATWNLSFLQTLTLIGPGLAAVGIGHTLHGAAPALGHSLTGLRRSLARSPDPADLGLHRPFTRTELAVVEDHLALPQELRHDRAQR